MIVKPTLDKRKKKDGTCAVKISVCHNGDTRFIPTDIHILPTEFSGGRIVKRMDSTLLNNKLQKQLLSVSEAIDKIEYTECLTCKELIDLMEGYTTIKNPTIADIFPIWYERLTCNATSKTFYKERYKYLIRYIKADTRLQNITTDTLNLTTAKMRGAGYADNTIRMEINLLRALLTFARNRKEITAPSPFIGYKLPRVVVKNNWVTKEQIKAMQTYELIRKEERFTNDMFLLSYYLGGLNQADLFHIAFISPTLSYIRTKTKGQNKARIKVEVEIHPKAQEIIDRWKNEEGYLIPPCENPEWADWVNFQLKYVRRKYGGEYTFGAARKSIAEHLFEMGCPTSVIDYILGHSIKQGTNCLYRYIKVTKELATQWLWKVIDSI